MDRCSAADGVAAAPLGDSWKGACRATSTGYGRIYVDKRKLVDNRDVLQISVPEHGRKFFFVLHEASMYPHV